MIVCLGTTPALQRSMTFARLTLDAVNRTANVREYASGKSTNVARVLHSLGNDVLATGFLGGARGEYFRSDLNQAGIVHDFVTVDAPTRMCITVIDESTGTATELLEEAQPLTAMHFDALHESVASHASRAKLLILSGNLPPGAHPHFYARCVQQFSRETRVILDIVGQPLLETLKLRPFVAKPNRSELARTLGLELNSEAATLDAMRQIHARGAAWVVVTHGREDTLVTDGDSVWKVTTPPLKVVSAIGSGDAFAAGLASALVRGDDVPQACVLAAACGAANALTPDAGHVRLDDLERLRGQIRITVV